MLESVSATWCCVSTWWPCKVQLTAPSPGWNVANHIQTDASKQKNNPNMPTKLGRPKTSTKSQEERDNARQLRMEKACKSAAKEKEAAGLRASMSHFVVQTNQARNNLVQEQVPAPVSTRASPAWVEVHDYNCHVVKAHAPDNHPALDSQPDDLNGNGRDNIDNDDAENAEGKRINNQPCPSTWMLLWTGWKWKPLLNNLASANGSLVSQHRMGTGLVPWTQADSASFLESQWMKRNTIEKCSCGCLSRERDGDSHIARMRDAIVCYQIMASARARRLPGRSLICMATTSLSRIATYAIHVKRRASNKLNNTKTPQLILGRAVTNSFGMLCHSIGDPIFLPFWQTSQVLTCQLLTWWDLCFQMGFEPPNWQKYSKNAPIKSITANGCNAS